MTPVPSLSWGDEKKPSKMGTFWEGMAQDADLSSESCRGERGTGQCQEQARRG